MKNMTQRIFEKTGEIHEALVMSEERLSFFIKMAVGIAVSNRKPPMMSDIITSSVDDNCTLKLATYVTIAKTRLKNNMV